MKQQRTPWATIAATWAISLALVAGMACASLSKSELAQLRKSPEILCKATVGTYRTRDFKTFSQLALSSAQIKDMLSKVQVPDAAKQASFKQRQAFWNKVEDSLSSVLQKSAIDWKQAEFAEFVPSRAPIQLAEGYRMHLGRMVVRVQDRKWAQVFNLVEVGEGRYHIGDFGPFEEWK